MKIDLYTDRDIDRAKLKPFTDLLMKFYKLELQIRAQQLGLQNCGRRTIKLYICQQIILRELQTLSPEEFDQLNKERRNRLAPTWKSLY